MTLSTLGILGAGTMGSGIAIASAFAGLEVILVDAKEAQVDAALNKAAAFAARQVEKRRMTHELADEALARLSGANEADALGDCDLIIEAVFEDFDLKARIFGNLSKIARDDAILATNTSCLRVSDLARHVTGPERFLGLHYFSPAEVNPLVEVVRGAQTSDQTFAAARDFVIATGKKPLACKDAYGFAVNRFFCPYTNEACRLVGEGLATTAQVDRVAKTALGVQAGPFFVQNMIKPQINLHAIGNLAPLGKFYAAAPFLVQVGSSDKPFEIGADGDAKNDPLIQDRMRAAVFLAILQELDEGVAEPEAIDMGAQVALRFQPPCQLMDSLGRLEVERIVKALADAHGLPLPKSLARVGRLRG